MKYFRTYCNITKGIDLYYVDENLQEQFVENFKSLAAANTRAETDGYKLIPVYLKASIDNSRLYNDK